MLCGAVEVVLLLLFVARVGQIAGGRPWVFGFIPPLPPINSCPRLVPIGTQELSRGRGRIMPWVCYILYMTAASL